MNKSLRFPYRAMPVQAAALEQIKYKGVTIGRRPGRYWAAWHHTAGWLDTGEIELAEAKAYVDHLLERREDSDEEVQG